MSRGREASRVAGIALLATAAALAFTWPLPRHASTAIPYAVGASPERSVVALVPGDHLQFYYFLAIAGDALRGEVPLFSDPYEFSAPEPSRRRNFFFLPFSTLFAAAAALVAEPAAYNLLVWLSFPATALATYALGRSLGLGPVPAVVSAFATTLVPYRVANVAGGHPAGFVFFLLPLVFWLLERSWRLASASSAAGAAAMIVVLALNEPHYLYFLAFGMPLWLVSALCRSAMPAPGRVRTTVAVATILALAAFGPAAAAAAYLLRRGERSPGALGFLLLLGASFVVLRTAWRLTAEARARAGQEDGRGEAVSYLPLGALALYPLQLALDVSYFGRALVVAVAAAALAAKIPFARAVAEIARKDEGRATGRRLAALWPVAFGLLAAVAFLFQFKGTIDVSAAATGRSAAEVALFSARAEDLLDRENTVLTRMLYPGVVPAALAVVGLASAPGRLLAAGAVAFGVLSLGFGAPEWLPLYPLAFAAVPYFSMIRQPAKLFAVAFLLLSLGAGFGAAWLRDRLGPRRGALAIAVALAVMAVDFSAVLPLGLSVLPVENRAYDTVAARAGQGNLLELPIWPGDSAYSSVYQYWSTRTKVPTVNGYSPTAPADYVSRVALPLGAMNLGEMTEAQARLLEELRVGFVTLHRDTFPPQVSAYPYRFTLAAMRENPNLELVTEDQGVYLFARRAAPYRRWTPRIAWPLGVFFEAEALRARTGLGVAVADPEASGGRIVRGRSSGAERGPFVYGPYRPFPSGSYRAIFRARGRGHVEVTTAQGAVRLAGSEVSSAAFAEAVVAFDLAEPQTLELRARAAPALDADWVLVEKLDAGAPGASTRIEAESFWTRSGFARETPGVSGAAVAVIVPSAAPKGSLVLDGPYRLVDAGPLAVAVRARGGAFRLRIESADGRRRIADLEVPVSEAWRTTRVDAVATRREVLCTRVISGGAEAEVDYVDLGPGEHGASGEPS